MTKVLKPKKKRLNETEEVPLPMVRCGVCGNLTTQGLHQVRLKLIRKGFMRKDKFGRLVRMPPLMKREDVYMCTVCVARGEKWPGKKPT